MERKPNTFAINYLNKRLAQEKRDLEMWNTYIENSTNEIIIAQAERNIPSTEHRIENLIESIQILKDNL